MKKVVLLFLLLCSSIRAEILDKKFFQEIEQNLNNSHKCFELILEKVVNIIAADKEVIDCHYKLTATEIDGLSSMIAEAILSINSYPLGGAVKMALREGRDLLEDSVLKKATELLAVLLTSLSGKGDKEHYLMSYQGKLSKKVDARIIQRIGVATSPACHVFWIIFHFAFRFATIKYPTASFEIFKEHVENMLGKYRPESEYTLLQKSLEKLAPHKAKFSNQLFLDICENYKDYMDCIINKTAYSPTGGVDREVGEEPEEINETSGLEQKNPFYKDPKIAVAVGGLASAGYGFVQLKKVNAKKDAPRKEYVKPAIFFGGGLAVLGSALWKLLSN